MKITLKSLVNKHEAFARNALKNIDELAPQLIVCIDNKIIATIIHGDRDAIKSVIEAISISDIKPDWVVFLTEGYTAIVEKGKPVENIRIGELGERFKAGDKSVIEAIIIQAYNSEGKLMRIIDKKTWKQIHGDSDEFDGYLAINDVDRIFWGNKNVGKAI